jgi:nucleotide-binding universal stress UspA family protein
MANIEGRRIMVAVDGSEQALEAVRYVAGILPRQGAEVVLFHVMTRVPESFWDLESNPAYRYRIANVEDWEKQQERSIGEFIAKARVILSDAGFEGEKIGATVQERKDGIARDIISESHKGYDAVVVGRTGLSRIKDLVLGSVADKLIGKMMHVPLWVVGDRPMSKKVLIPIDASEGSMQAVEHVAAVLGGAADVGVTLFHAIRGLEIFTQGFGDSFVVDYDAEWIGRAEKQLDEAEVDMRPVLAEAEDRLTKAGFSPDRVDHKIARGVRSRAGSIAREAEEGDYGTVVMGRRGLSKVQEFFMGRVSSKVLHLAKNKAVWVVS